MNPFDMLEFAFCEEDRRFHLLDQRHGLPHKRTVESAACGKTNHYNESIYIRYRAWPLPKNRNATCWDCGEVIRKRGMSSAIRRWALDTVYAMMKLGLGEPEKKEVEECEVK